MTVFQRNIALTVTEAEAASGEGQIGTANVTGKYRMTTSIIQHRTLTAEILMTVTVPTIATETEIETETEIGTGTGTGTGTGIVTGTGTGTGTEGTSEMTIGIVTGTGGMIEGKTKTAGETEIGTETETGKKIEIETGRTRETRRRPPRPLTCKRMTTTRDR